MIEISVTFQGAPGDQRDQRCRKTIEEHGGSVLAAGTFLPTMERDVDAHVPDDRANACIEMLRNQGFQAGRRNNSDGGMEK